MLRILIADDHCVVRAGLRRIISDVADMEVVDEVASANEALDKIRKTSYSVVLLDISMPGKSGLEALKEIKSEFPQLPVLMLTGYPEDQYAIRALRSGAAGYMTKEAVPQDLIAAIRTVAIGRKYVSTSLAERLAFNLDITCEKEAHEMLSDREYEVLCLIASGKNITQIAEQLCLSVKTISSYKGRILDKLQLKNNSELANYAIKNGLIS